MPSTTAPRPGGAPCLTREMRVTTGQSAPAPPPRDRHTARPHHRRRSARAGDARRCGNAIPCTSAAPRRACARSRPPRHARAARPPAPRGPARGEEIPGDHRVEDGRIARQMRSQRRRGPGDVHQQVDQLRIGLEQREELHPAGSPARNPSKASSASCGSGAPAATGYRAQPLENLHRAARAQRRIAGPARDISGSKSASAPRRGPRLPRGQRSLDQLVHPVSRSRNSASSSARSRP